ncbi:MAG: thiamine phosphate synthase [Bacteroidota bacterium]
MQVIVITPDIEVYNEVEIINELFIIGLNSLSLRKTSYNEHELAAYIQSIDKQYHSRITIHNHYQLCNEFDLRGIHLSSFAREDPNTCGIVTKWQPKSVSTSFHSWEEIGNNVYPYSYVFISPVFDSISKQGYKANIDLQQATATRNHCRSLQGYCPQIIGLGGVNDGNIGLLRKNGFDGAAVLGAVWKAADPVSSFIEIIAAIS